MGTIMEEQKKPTVNLSQHSSFMSSLKTQLKETFFPDDPFRHFSGLPPRRRAWFVLSYFAPILQWAPNYKPSFFAYDLLAGITITSLAIPQGISYAKLANISPVIGLYSSFTPPLVYAVFGSSNNLAVGTAAAVSLLLSSSIRDTVSPENEPEKYLFTIFTAAFFSGVFQLALGIFRLGILVDFLSRSAITGYMAGAAMIIILQQLKGLLGLQHFTSKTDVVSVVEAVFQNRHEWKWQSAILGLCFIIILLATRRLKEKIQRLFWVNAISPLLVIIIGGVLAFVVKGKDHGIPIVGELKKGLNPISLSQLQFKSPYLSAALQAGLVAGFTALAEGIAVGRSFGLLKNERTDGNNEMIAFGLMNIVGSFTSCYVTTGPFSKSAVNYHAGCRTPMSNVIMALCMMLVLLFLAPLFKYTPLVALSAIIVVAMLGLIELLDMQNYPDSTTFPGFLILQLGSPIYFVNASYLRERITRWVEAEENCTEEKGQDLHYIIFDMGGVAAIDNTGIGMLFEVYRMLGKKMIQMAITNPRGQVVEKLMAAGFIDVVGKEWIFLSIQDAVSGCNVALEEGNKRNGKQEHA